MVAKGFSVMVMSSVEESAAQPPSAASKYLTVYVPGVLADGFTTPVELLIDNPAAELNTPPVDPMMVGAGVEVSVLQ